MHQWAYMAEDWIISFWKQQQLMFRWFETAFIKYTIHHGSLFRTACEANTVAGCTLMYVISQVWRWTAKSIKRVRKIQIRNRGSGLSEKSSFGLEDKKSCRAGDRQVLQQNSESPKHWRFCIYRPNYCRWKSIFDRNRFSMIDLFSLSGCILSFL
jgi:hypothetical protein